MLLSQVIDEFKSNINKARTYQGGIVLVEPRKVREVKSLLRKEVDIKESYIGTAQKFFLEEIINEFAHHISDCIYCRDFDLIEEDICTTETIDYLRHCQLPITRINDVVLMCLPLAYKCLMAKYKFLITDTKIDDRILTAISNLGIQVLYKSNKTDVDSNYKETLYEHQQ